MREDTIRLIRERKVIAIVRGLAFEHMEPFANALKNGGIQLVEVTFVQDDPASWAATCESIRLLNRLGICAGAGTVVTQEQLKLAAEAGANYIISPNTNEAIIRKTREMNLVSIPGAMTPSEIVSAYEYGADFVKVFPASVLGSAYIKAVRAPLKHIPMLAVGGISADNMRDYIKAGCLGVGVGGKLVSREWIEAGEFDKIEQAARAYTEAAK